MFDDRDFSVRSTMTDDGHLTIEVGGELDVDTAERLTVEIDKRLGIKELTVDLRECTFIDSKGIASLVRCRHEIGYHATMRLIGVPPNIDRTLRLAGLEAMLGLEV